VKFRLPVCSISNKFAGLLDGVLLVLRPATKSSTELFGTTSDPDAIIVFDERNP
jgi:hypothetical protein